MTFIPGHGEITYGYKDTLDEENWQPTFDLANEQLDLSFGGHGRRVVQAGAALTAGYVAMQTFPLAAEALFPTTQTSLATSSFQVASFAEVANGAPLLAPSVQSASSSTAALAQTIGMVSAVPAATVAGGALVRNSDYESRCRRWERMEQMDLTTYLMKQGSSSVVTFDPLNPKKPLDHFKELLAELKEQVKQGELTQADKEKHLTQEEYDQYEKELLESVYIPKMEDLEPNGESVFGVSAYWIGVENVEEHEFDKDGHDIQEESTPFGKPYCYNKSESAIKNDPTVEGLTSKNSERDDLFDIYLDDKMTRKYAEHLYLIENNSKLSSEREKEYIQKAEALMNAALDKQMAYHIQGVQACLKSQLTEKAKKHVKTIVDNGNAGREKALQLTTEYAEDFWKDEMKKNSMSEFKRMETYLEERAVPVEVEESFTTADISVFKFLNENGMPNHFCSEEFEEMDVDPISLEEKDALVAEKDAFLKEYPMTHPEKRRMQTSEACGNRNLIYPDQSEVQCFRMPAKTQISKTNNTYTPSAKVGNRRKMPFTGLENNGKLQLVPTLIREDQENVNGVAS